MLLSSEKSDFMFLFLNAEFLSPVTGPLLYWHESTEGQEKKKSRVSNFSSYHNSKPSSRR